MNSQEFVRAVTAFADAATDIDLTRGELAFQLRDQIITAKLYHRDGKLWVDEADAPQEAEQWLIHRVAKVDLLADRILSQIVDPKPFIVPEATVVDDPNLESPPAGEAKDAGAGLISLLDRRPAGTTTVVYLTSDAGEGKTTLISQLALRQAAAFKAKKADWLLVPVTLGGGRTFVRFDDVVVASLVNRLRFPYWYYEAFLELVRLGVVVPAFDGFEEMLIESSSNEALSALGGFARSLTSSGSAVVSARKAFFEYQSFAAQARVFEGLSDQSVVFTRIGLKRWQRHQFVAYASSRGIADANALYDAVAARLGASHPVLTRAVLVRRLVDVAGQSGGLADLLSRLGAKPEDYFAEFVNAIVEREATEKWLDTSGDPPTPLLSVNEHHELLAAVANEMWLNSSDTLKDDLLDLVCEVFVESKRLSPVVGRQVRERLKQHSLLVRAEVGRTSFAFDHEDFRNYFQGVALGRLLVSRDIAGLRSFLRVAAVTGEMGDAVISHLRRMAADAPAILDVLQKVGSLELPSSFGKENAGILAIRVAETFECTTCEFRSLSFPTDALRLRKLRGSRFTDCYFQPTSVEEADLRGLVFTRCQFERLSDIEDARHVACVCEDCTVRCVTIHGGAESLFDPREISRFLADHGFAQTQQLDLRDPAPVEEDLKLTERALRMFLRANQLNESAFRTQLGQRSAHFLDEVLPELVRHEILTEVTYQGAGRQRRFRLIVPLDLVQEAFAECRGDFSKFLASLATARRQQTH